MNIEISKEQAETFANELYYGSDLIADIKKCIAEHPEEYELFIKNERNSDKHQQQN